MAKRPGVYTAREEKKKPLPERVYTDARGTTLKPGVRVAFNYSGDVAIGVIHKITKAGEFQIERETHTTGYHSNNTLSRVKNARSIISIREDETIDHEIAEAVNQLTAEITTANEEFAALHDKILAAVANAWDLDDVEVLLEEVIGVNWKNQYVQD